jgi:hypothetical protein
VASTSVVSSPTPAFRPGATLRLYLRHALRPSRSAGLGAGPIPGALAPEGQGLTTLRLQLGVKVVVVRVVEEVEVVAVVVAQVGRRWAAPGAPTVVSVSGLRHRFATKSRLARAQQLAARSRLGLRPFVVVAQNDSRLRVSASSAARGAAWRSAALLAARGDGLRAGRCRARGRAPLGAASQNGYGERSIGYVQAAITR